MILSFFKRENRKISSVKSPKLHHPGELKNNLILNLQNIIKEKNEIFLKNLSAKSGDIDGLKTLMLYIPEVFYGEKYIPNRFKKLIISDAECLDDENFIYWLKRFIEKCILTSFSKGENLKKAIDYPEYEELFQLNNLGLTLLRKKIDDIAFDRFLFSKLTIDRVKVIYENFRVDKLVHSDRGYDLSMIQRSAYIGQYNKMIDQSKIDIIHHKKRDFFYRVLDQGDQKYLRGFFEEKTPYEAALIMIELDEVRKLKFFNYLTRKNQVKVTSLFSGGDQKLRNGRVFERAIKTIEKDYYQGLFRLTSSHRF